MKKGLSIKQIHQMKNNNSVKSITKLSNEKPTIQKSKSKGKIKQETKDPYFCHYKNAMYMGNAKIFQKNGRGILMHDDGTTGITNHVNDMLHQQNLFFLPNGAIVSGIFAKDKVVEAIYKNKQKIFYAKYKNQVLDGYAILINFKNKQIAYGLFKKGSLIDRSYQQQPDILRKIFQAKQLEAALPINLLKFLNLELSPIKGIQIVKRINKINIGFYKNSQINGLGFILVYRLGQNINLIDQFNLQLIEKGYYKNSQLDGLGERKFKNGNVYIGEFKNDLFQGQGVLKNYVKENWVSGIFEQGNMIELLKYNNEGDIKIAKNYIQSIHKKKTTYLSKEINLVTPIFFQKDIQKIEKFRQDENEKLLTIKKQEVLNRILNNFTSDNEQQAGGIFKKQDNRIKIPQRWLPDSRKNDDFLNQNLKQQLFSPLNQKNNSYNRYQEQRSETFRKNESFNGIEDIPQSHPFQFEIKPVPYDSEMESSIKVESSSRKKYQDDSLNQNQSSKKITTNNLQQSKKKIDPNKSITDSKTLVGVKSLSLLSGQKKTFNQTRQRSPIVTPQKKINTVGTQKQKSKQQNILDSIYKNHFRKSHF